ncbi:MAG: hypothetical protein IJX11_09325 [Bacteroidales bacterium]|nr:hypothetical protein [Bacteroidales bacterium]
MNSTIGSYPERTNISSQTLFHFTSSYNVIEKILSPSSGQKISGFKFSKIYEKIAGTKLAYFVDSISFCDIPLSMVKNHVNWYGAYAIGIKRSALKILGASPVFYSHSKTDRIPHNSNSNSIEFFKSSPWFTSRLKQVYGKQVFENDGELYFKNRKFYNEREWRIVGNIEQMEVVSYKNESELIQYRKQIAPSYLPNVEVAIDDIEYIILEKSTDLPNFVSFVSTHYPTLQNEFLTKVLLYDKLKNDL